MKQFINLTPHDIKLNSGEVLAASGKVARVSSTFTDFKDGVCNVIYGDIENLPEAQEGVMYVVSALVLAAVSSTRKDVVAPATGHPGCVRKDGFIVSVPGFVQ